MLTGDNGNGQPWLRKADPAATNASRGVFVGTILGVLIWVFLLNLVWMVVH